ncbi:MAG: hypothetical protein GXO75_03240 [Calditrichaeota bacterium]|nr:hypothetical protein [Calditrichota bacterium]
MKKSLLFLSLAAVLTTTAVFACQKDSQSPEENTASSTTVNQITPQKLAEMMTNKDFILINVHIPYAGELPNTDLFIPFNDIEGNADKLPKEMGAKIVVYCRSGGMSAGASKELLDRGYTNIYDLTGGMNAWKNAGFELLDKSP